jgi:ERCC4-related helicase
LNNIYSQNKDIKTIIFVPTRKLAYLLSVYINRNNLYKSEYIAGVNTKKEEYLFLSLSTKITNNVLNERIKRFNEGDTNILICTPSVIDNLQITKCDYIIIFNELSNTNWDYTRIKNLGINNKSKLIIFTFNENNIKNYFMKKIIENDKMMIFFEQNDIMKDFRGKNYLDEKLENIKKQKYYIIEETQAKVSMRNSMMIYNVINNWFLQQNKKLIINKSIEE